MTERGSGSKATSKNHRRDQSNPLCVHRSKSSNNKLSSYSNISLIDYLENVISTGTDTWRATCPSHQGRRRSLAIERVDGRWLVHCFAGCAALDIVESVGLNLSDLFDKDPYSKSLARHHRIHKNARNTLEAIQAPITILMMGINEALDGKITGAELNEVNQAYRTISTAMESAGIQTKELEDISRRVRNAT